MKLTNNIYNQTNIALKKVFQTYINNINDEETNLATACLRKSANIMLRKSLDDTWAGSFLKLNFCGKLWIWHGEYNTFELIVVLLKVNEVISLMTIYFQYFYQF